ncbi:hypothetical protein DSO57_1026975 [Entomophthora muscae]|uniref:Uncharacterized protein n=1 Tax=Entomophthora muscae TaxID=34485 RepID=A0ACC2UMP5_9FUNG|nr:hypothetical protein DSO57_1026975 [Entomophthora muscae]
MRALSPWGQRPAGIWVQGENPALGPGFRGLLLPLGAFALEGPAHTTGWGNSSPVSPHAEKSLAHSWSTYPSGHWEQVFYYRCFSFTAPEADVSLVFPNTSFHLLVYLVGYYLLGRLYSLIGTVQKLSHGDGAHRSHSSQTEFGGPGSQDWKSLSSQVGPGPLLAPISVSPFTLLFLLSAFGEALEYFVYLASKKAKAAAHSCLF